MTTRPAPVAEQRLPWIPAPAEPVAFTPRPVVTTLEQAPGLDDLAAGGEVRVTSSTGGAKGVKIEAFDLMPAGPMREVARHYGIGNIKYPPVNGISNWRNGFPWSQSYAAALRHLNAFWDGEDIDEETGSKHVVAAAWQCLALIEYMNRPDLAHFDDRQSKITNALMAAFEAQQAAAQLEQTDHELPAAAAA